MKGKNRGEQFIFYYHEKGIKLDVGDLFLDADRVVPLSFISHGHSDHLRNHKNILATAPTIQFFKHRFADRVKKPTFIPLNYQEEFLLEHLKVTLFPAGHILGSAMILIEDQNTRLLYSGDFKLRNGRSAEPVQIPETDILIMESTFGHPDYRFSKQRDQIPDELQKCIEKIQKEKKLPIVLAYSMGKAQEAMMILGELGFRVKVHPSAWNIAKIYQDFNIQFPNCCLFNGEIDIDNDVLIIPPHFLRYQNRANFPPFRSIFLSGWAKKPNPNFRIHSDYALPLSDHADFDELLEFAALAKPKKIYTLHGFPGFPKYLKEAGFDAEYLGKP